MISDRLSSTTPGDRPRVYEWCNNTITQMKRSRKGNQFVPFEIDSGKSLNFTEVLIKAAGYSKGNLTIRWRSCNISCRDEPMLLRVLKCHHSFWKCTNKNGPIDLYYSLWQYKPIHYGRRFTMLVVQDTTAQMQKRAFTWLRSKKKVKTENTSGYWVSFSHLKCFLGKIICLLLLYTS